MSDIQLVYTLLKFFAKRMNLHNGVFLLLIWCILTAVHIITLFILCLTVVATLVIDLKWGPKWHVIEDQLVGFTDILRNYNKYIESSENAIIEIARHNKSLALRQKALEDLLNVTNTRSSKTDNPDLRKTYGYKSK